MLIDIHSHILPNADHGSSDLESSIEMCRKAAGAGLAVVVATPHFYLDADSIEDFLARRDISYGRLAGAAQYPKILRGAEVALYPGIESLSRLHELCIEDTDYILLELPNGVVNDWVYNAIFEIQSSRKLRPVIAHVERYTKEVLNRLLTMKIVLQINASSLLSRKNRVLFMNILKNKATLVLGSDAHGAGHNYQEFTYVNKKMDLFFEETMNNAGRMLRNEIFE